jgi:membrane protease YdiL (CAAX protease family)
MGEIGSFARSSRPDKLAAVKLLGIAVAWLALGHYLPLVLWHALPRALLDSLSLPVYSMICQAVTTVVGLAASWGLLRAPRDELGARLPTGWDGAITVLATPLAFVLASWLALKIAEPYLLEELATQGAGASRKNAGAFGRAVTQAPLLVTILWGAVLAAVTEELMFRGALFGAVRAATSRLGRASGIVAVVLAAAVFGAMHADMQGSVGIVRVASTTCLGLACGGARLLSGSVLASMLLHFTYNTISLGIGRGWFQGASEPLVSVVPNPLLAMAVGAALVSGALAIIRARRAALPLPP